MSYYTRNMDDCNWISENLFRNITVHWYCSERCFCEQSSQKNENLSVKSCGCMSFV